MKIHACALVAGVATGLLIFSIPTRGGNLEDTKRGGGVGYKDNLKNWGVVIHVLGTTGPGEDGYLIVKTNNKQMKYVVNSESQGWKELQAFLEKIAKKKGKAFVQLSYVHAGAHHGAALIEYAEERN